MKILVPIFLLVFVAGMVYADELTDLQQILNATRGSWTADHTSVSRLPVAEQQAMCSLLPGIYNLKDFPAETIDRNATVEREAYESKSTGIKDQASCGSCYSFGACATYEGWALKNQSTSLDLSEQYFMMKAKALDTEGYGGCNGWYLDTSMNLLKNYGVAPESCCKYLGYESACGSGCTGTYKIKGWAATTDKATIQNAVKAKGHVYVGFAVYSDFSYYTSGYYAYSSGYLRGYHAVCVVGFDDTGFKVKNSWGTGWGESGFFRITYAQMTNSVQFGTCFGGSFYITD
jgi:C1A family cysteine protease